MDGGEQDILRLLKEIRDLLVPISACFEEQYAEIRRQRLAAQLKAFAELMTPARRKIFPLLFENLSQVEIASRAHTTQPTVSRLINSLLGNGLIAEEKDVNGQTRYVDEFDLKRELATMDGGK